MPKTAASATRRRRGASASQGKSRKFSFDLHDSPGYQLRQAARAMHRVLQARLVPYRINIGMWYFLRVLWAEDGLTQRELSRRIGIREPTTLHTVAVMERNGLVKRVRNAADRRKVNVFLTTKGRALEPKLSRLALTTRGDATAGMSNGDLDQLLTYLRTIQANLKPILDQLEEMDWFE